MKSSPLSPAGLGKTEPPPVGPLETSRPPQDLCSPKEGSRTRGSGTGGKPSKKRTLYPSTWPMPPRPPLSCLSERENHDEPSPGATDRRRPSNGEHGSPRRVSLAKPCEEVVKAESAGAPAAVVPCLSAENGSGSSNESTHLGQKLPGHGQSQEHPHALP